TRSVAAASTVRCKRAFRRLSSRWIAARARPFRGRSSPLVLLTESGIGADELRDVLAVFGEALVPRRSWKPFSSADARQLPIAHLPNRFPVEHQLPNYPGSHRMSLSPRCAIHTRKRAGARCYFVCGIYISDIGSRADADRRV